MEISQNGYLGQALTRISAESVKLYIAAKSKDESLIFSIKSLLAAYSSP